MAALIPGYKYYNNIVNFDLPDGNTSLGYICYYVYLNFTLQMAALIGLLSIIIF